jgi:predicted RNA methylase
MRHVVRGCLPLGKGVVLDPFAGSASTLAAANSVGYASIALEVDPAYIEVARSALPRLSGLGLQEINPVFPQFEDAGPVKRSGSSTKFATGFFLKSASVT